MRRSVLLILLAGPVALAGDPKQEAVDSKGMPKDYKVGASTRYAIWRDDVGWHFRYTTASDRAMAFTGTIEPVGGRISSITPRGSAAKGVKTGDDATPIKLSRAKYNFNAKLVNGYEGGIDFTVDDKATAIKFDLKINGKEVPALIYIGSKGTHPKTAAVELPVK